jgi:hypothetical protein
MRSLQRPGALALVITLSFSSSCTTPAQPLRANDSIAVQALVNAGPGWARKRNFIGSYDPTRARFVLKMTRPGWSEVPARTQVIGFGNPHDTPLVGDWDGDGRESLGVWRDGIFILANTLGGPADLSFSYQKGSDVPVVGDWDGDGRTTVGVFRDGVFLLRNSNSAGPADLTFTFGATGDIPVAGDWDGDGIDTVGVFRPSTATFLLINRHASDRAIDIKAQVDAPFANAERRPVVGDWNQDGVVSVGVKSGGDFFLKNDSAGVTHAYVDEDGYAHSFREGDEIHDSVGAVGDIPISGNWVPNASPGTSAVPSVLVNRFPLAVWQQDPRSFDIWKSAGINTVVMATNHANDSGLTNADRTRILDAYTAAARAKNLLMVREPIPRQGSFDAEAGAADVLAWNMWDEPDAGSGSPEEIIGTYNKLKALNPGRPAFTNFVGEYILDPTKDNINSCNGRGDFPNATQLDCYSEFLKAQDWLSQDWYPVSRGYSLATTGRILDKLTRWSGGRPLFAFIEASSVFLPTRVVPWNQVHAQVWLAIVHGARGIFYFTNGPCKGGCIDKLLADARADATVLDPMRATNKFITALAPTLQSTINPPSIGMRAVAPLEVGWRDAGSKRIFIVVNPLGKDLGNVMLTVAGFTPSGPFIRLDDNGHLGTAGQRTFTDSFGPYAVHVYQAP